MRPGVRADGMALGLHLLGDVGELLHHLANVEKRRLRTLRGECCQDFLGVGRVRPVVEGQDHLALLQQRRRRVLIPE